MQPGQVLMTKFTRNWLGMKWVKCGNHFFIGQETVQDHASTWDTLIIEHQRALPRAPLEAAITAHANLRYNEMAIQTNGYTSKWVKIMSLAII